MELQKICEHVIEKPTAGGGIVLGGIVSFMSAGICYIIYPEVREQPLEFLMATGLTTLVTSSMCAGTFYIRSHLNKIIMDKYLQNCT